MPREEKDGSTTSNNETNPAGASPGTAAQTTQNAGPGASPPAGGQQTGGAGPPPPPNARTGGGAPPPPNARTGGGAPPPPGPRGGAPPGPPGPRPAAAKPTFEDPVIGEVLSETDQIVFYNSSDTPEIRRDRSRAGQDTFGEYMLRLGPRRMYWWSKQKSRESGVAKLEPTPEPLAGLSNAQHQWLTYETLFNQRMFRKTNQRCQFGLYRIPLGNVKVFLREEIEESLLKTLAEAFFPDVEIEKLKNLAVSFWPWKDTSKGRRFHESPETVLASRDTNVLHLKQYAIMPVNYADNGKESRSIGLRETTNMGTKLKKLNASWSFWKTASRSVLAQLDPVKDKGEPWGPLLEDEFKWDILSAAPVRPKDAELGSSERGVDLKDAAAAGDEFKLASAKNAFSVKAGVQYVGFSDQMLTHKDLLEENSVIACLRSDLIVEMDKKAGRNPKSDKDIVIQTELLSITELDKTGKVEFGDGIQVRDLSVLDKNKIYFPPISIPFVGTDLTDIKRRFEGAEDEAWRTFWKQAYAEKLGRAKALLMLRYGLQMGSPNAQNMLLEFGTDLKPTGRVIFRDVGDMYLHREVLWARLGGKGPPPQAKDEKFRLVELDSKIVQFEAGPLAQGGSSDEEWREYVPYETGTLYEQSYGPSGTRMLWHRFSTLSKGSSVLASSVVGTDPDAYTAGWPRVLATMGEWGIAHGKAYVGVLQEKLGLTIEINWDSAPDPQRYLALKETDGNGASNCYEEDLKWEDQASDIIHGVLASEAGQNALRALKE